MSQDGGIPRNETPIPWESFLNALDFTDRSWNRNFKHSLNLLRVYI